ncbi:MAG: peptide-methionine (S)-S-oxide reductase MsrA [Gemmatimonadota bacterium]
MSELDPGGSAVDRNPSAVEAATLAGGCFWCLEAAYLEVEGVLAVRSGYMGGHHPNPSYDLVCTGTTGHAEVVRLEFDPAVIGYGDILEIFFTIHDPTTLDRQGGDVGPQYRSAIFHHSEQQRDEAGRLIASLEAGGTWTGIVTEVTAATEFFPAEAYHHRYYERNPTQGYCSAVISPKLAKLRAKHADRLRAGVGSKGTP